MQKEDLVRIRIEDIPPEGRSVEFDLSVARVNERVNLNSDLSADTKAELSTVVFDTAPHATIDLTLEGSTVLIHGNVTGAYKTVCARCAEETRKEFGSEIDLVLKPRSDRGVVGAEEEDLNFGLYDGEAVECAGIAEEFLVLSLPFADVCSDDCKGLCSQCGQNLNSASCDCKAEKSGDPRLQALRDLKILQ